MLRDTTVWHWGVPALQGTLVVVPLLPYGLAEHIYGPDALLFKPQRWLPTSAAAPMQGAARSAAPAGPQADSSSAAAPSVASSVAATEGPSTLAAAPGGSAPSAQAVGGSKAAPTAAPPDPLTFMTGQRDW